MLLRLREKALKGDARALDQFIRLAQVNNDGPNDALGGQEMLAEDREILDAYAEALRSRPSSEVGADRGPGESSGSDVDEYLPEFDDPSPTGMVPETESEPERER
jgi:hypothetical protein